MFCRPWESIQPSSWWKALWSTAGVRDGDCYWTSSHCIPAEKIVSGELNHNCLPLVLDSDKGVCYHHSSLCTWIEYTFTAESMRLSRAGSTVYFLRTICYCLHLLNRVFGVHSIGFLLHATELEWKSALKIPRWSVSLETQGSGVSGNTLQQVETFKYLEGCYSRVTEGRTRRLIHGLVKQMQFCVSFFALWSQNGSFQTPQRCQFYWSLFQSLPIVWSKILGNDWKNVISSASGRDGIFAESPRCDTSQ